MSGRFVCEEASIALNAVRRVASLCSITSNGAGVVVAVRSFVELVAVGGVVPPSWMDKLIKLVDRDSYLSCAYMLKLVVTGEGRQHGTKRRG